MTTDQNCEHPLDETDSRSSIFVKLPQDQRRLLDQALTEYDPPSYRALFSKFKLADFGISFTAFYRYARRIRHQADLFDLAELVLPQDSDIPAAIHNLVSRRLLESLLHEDPSPRAIQRLTDAYRVATATLLALRRQDEFMKAAVRKQRQHDADCFRSATQAFKDVLKQRIATLETSPDAAADPSSESS